MANPQCQTIVFDDEGLPLRHRTDWDSMTRAERLLEVASAIDKTKCEFEEKYGANYMDIWLLNSSIVMDGLNWTPPKMTIGNLDHAQ